MTFQEVLKYKWLQKYHQEENDVFQRRKIRDLSGAKKFEAFSTMNKSEKKEE